MLTRPHVAFLTHSGHCGGFHFALQKVPDRTRRQRITANIANLPGLPGRKDGS